MANKTGQYLPIADDQVCRRGRRRRLVLTALMCWVPCVAVAENPRLNRAHGEPVSDALDDGSDSGGLFGIRSILRSGRDDDTVAPDDLLHLLPMQRLTPQARERIASVTDKPSFRRRLPSQAIRCDEDLFLFLTRAFWAVFQL